MDLGTLLKIVTQWFGKLCLAVTLKFKSEEYIMPETMLRKKSLIVDVNVKNDILPT